MQEKILEKLNIIKEKKEIDREVELITSIIKVKEELKVANMNFEFVENDLVDYYVYQIKANQAKLNYLLKLAKAKGIVVDRAKELKYRNSYMENDEAV